MKLTHSLPKEACANYNLASTTEKKLLPRTVYGREWATVIFDEVHIARRASVWPYHSYRRLASQSMYIVGLTATPVVTAPSDLWNIGRLLYVDAFSEEHDEELAEYGRILTKAKRKATKERQGAPSASQQLRRGIATQDDLLNVGNVPSISAIQGQEIRKRMEDHCIRRTLKSVDWEGKAISQLDMYQEHIIKVKLHKSEHNFLEGQYDELDEALCTRKPEAVSINYI